MDTKLAFFDIDNTIFNGYTSTSFLNYLVIKKVIAKNILDEIQIQDDLYATGEINYKNVSLKHQQIFAKGLKNLSEDEIYNHGLAFLEETDRFFQFVKPVFKFLEEHRFKIYLISGTIHIMTTVIRDFLGATDSFGSNFEAKNGLFTGRVINMLHYGEKAKIVKNILKKSSKSILTVGFGDSSGDVDFLLLVKKAFLINPHEEKLLKLAKNRNWLITRDPNIIISGIKELL